RHDRNQLRSDRARRRRCPEPSPAAEEAPMPPLQPEEPVAATTPRAWPDVDHVITEDDTPVDNRFSTHEMRLLVDLLLASWPGPAGDRRFVTDANGGVFPSVNEPPLVPDFFLSLGVDWPKPIWAKRNRSYFVEGFGKPPDLVVEIVSND